MPAVAITVPLTMLLVQELRRFLVPVVLSVALVVALVFAAVPAVRAHATTRVSDVTTVQNREALDGAAEAMIMRRPLFGYGWGTFIRVAPGFFQSRDSYDIEQLRGVPLHEVYYSIATDLGLVGLTLWLLILVWCVGGAIFDRGVPPDVRPWR